MVHDNDDVAMRRDVLQRLMLVTRLINADMERSLGPAGLTMVRAQVLWELGAEPGMTQRQLATRLEVTPRNVTALIDALERDGFVERRAHPSDRRAIQLMLTNKGATVYEQFREGLDQFAVQVLGDVSTDRLERLRTEIGDIVSKLLAIAANDRQRS